MGKKISNEKEYSILHYYFGYQTSLEIGATVGENVWAFSGDN